MSFSPNASPVDIVKSGLEGLDTILGGGIPPGSLIMLVGEPGTGKTTLLQQLCFTWPSLATTAATNNPGHPSEAEAGSGDGDREAQTLTSTGTGTESGAAGNARSKAARTSRSKGSPPPVAGAGAASSSTSTQPSAK